MCEWLLEGIQFIIYVLLKQERRMREAFANQPKTKIAQSHQPSQQISHRSGQQHQKNNSLSLKANQNFAQQMFVYDDSAQLRPNQNQPSTQTNSIASSIGIVPASHVYQIGGIGPINGNNIQTKAGQGASGHKKSNSLMNSKMAQILLKGAPGSLIINNNTGLTSLHQQHHVNQPQYMATQHQQQLYNNGVMYNVPGSQLANGKSGTSAQNSFLNSNEIASYSIDYSKPACFFEEYDGMGAGDVINTIQHQMKVISSNPSNKQLHQLNQVTGRPSQFQEYTQQQQDIEQPSRKQVIQSASITIKNNSITKNSTIQNSNQKSLKKASGQSIAPHHQRTKSDNIYNRGSLIQNPVTIPAQNMQQTQTQQRSAQQSVASSKQRSNAGSNNVSKLHNNQYEANQMRPTHHQKNASTGFVIFNQPLQSVPQTALGQRKPGSASHSKKPSQSSNSNAIQVPSVQQHQSGKKTTREKYLELKGLYNDLLERHYAQQQQFSNSISTGKMSQHPSNQAISLQYPGLQQFQQQQYMIQQQLDALHNIHTQNTSTPRIAISNQMSSTTLNSHPFPVNSDKAPLNQQPQSKTVKHTSIKTDSSMMGTIDNNVQPKLQLKQQVIQQAKTAIKLNIAQGQSRKGASGATHKRSVSDGNEHFFKFKQGAMQRYLYPQPSQGMSGQSHQMGIYKQGQIDLEDAIPLSKDTVPLIQQQPGHQRRVSDDFYQKQKKAQLHLQQQLTGVSAQQMNRKQQHQHLLENVPSEQPNETQKPQTVDFNIKGFLIEMRNKQEKGAKGSSNSFISVVDDEKIKLRAQLSPKTKAEKEFAMIIEENSPSGLGGNLQGHRKMSVTESNGNILSKQQQQQQQPPQNFNKMLQKYKNIKVDDFQEVSPNRLFSDQNPKSVKEVSQQRPQQVTHKRVKSDIQEAAKKKPNPLSIPTNIIHNLNKGSGILNKKSSQQTSGSNIFSSDKNTPKKPVPNYGKQKYPAGSIQFNQSHQFDGTASKKIINVSIDLIKEAEMDLSSIGDDLNHDGAGHWIVVDNNSQSDLAPEGNKIKFKPATKKQNFIQNSSNGNVSLNVGLSGSNNEQNRQEKYKKIASKYEIDPSQVKKKSNPSSPLMSQTPQNRLSSLNESKDRKNVKMQSPKHFKKEMIKPVQNGPQTQVIKKGNLQINFSKQHLLQQQLAQPQEQLVKALPPNNSVVQTQESARNSLITTQQNVNLNLQNLVGERLDTQDSTVSDQNVSPRSRYMNKLIKHIKLSFRQTSQAPSTTVDFYRIGKVLGKGAFGKVNLALHKLTQKFAAVKSINKQYLSEEAQTKKVMQEVVILKRTRHRNIVRLYEFFETQKHILFVIELCAGGDLLNYVRKRRRLKEDVARHIFKQIIEGLGYCHSKSIVHRDIKLDNILLDSEGEVKICDFGVSKIVKKNEKMTEQCGTPAYIAPEILRDKGYQGFQVDVWSAGVVLYAMLYGTVPFKANNMSELQKLIQKAKYTLKDDISEEARDLLTKLLEVDPEKRLKIPEILLHKWLIQDQGVEINLFTEQEKDYIKAEFTYNDTDRYNRNEVDPFTEHMLDTAQDEMFKNCSTKSVVLAPFNSTKSNIEQEYTLTDTIKQMMQSKRCIKFAPRVRDIDKQYEINNNAELDNGVYHKFEEEEEKVEAKKESSDDSLQSSFNKQSSIRSNDDDEELRIKDKSEKKQRKKKKAKQTEMEKLESLINQEELDDQEGENPYGANEEIMIKDQQHEQQVKQDTKRSPRLSVGAVVSKPQNAVIQSAATLIIEEKLVPVIEAFGYPKEYIVKSLNMNELNYATTAYYLLKNENAMSACPAKDSQFLKSLVSL